MVFFLVCSWQWQLAVAVGSGGCFNLLLTAAAYCLLFFDLFELELFFFEGLLEFGAFGAAGHGVFLFGFFGIVVVELGFDFLDCL